MGKPEVIGSSVGLVPTTPWWPRDRRRIMLFVTANGGGFHGEKHTQRAPRTVLPGCPTISAEQSLPCWRTTISGSTVSESKPPAACSSETGNPDPEQLERKAIAAWAPNPVGRLGRLPIAALPRRHASTDTGKPTCSNRRLMFAFLSILPYHELVS